MWRQLQRQLLETTPYRGLTVLRVALASVVFAHGAQKVLGWFGGMGPEATLNWLTGSMGVPSALAVLVLATEFVGALALLAGAYTRLAALAIAAEMTGVVLKVHLQNGFFMNWAGQARGEGYEFFVLVIGIALSLALLGGGAWSVDRVLSREAMRPA